MNQDTPNPNFYVYVRGKDGKVYYSAVYADTREEAMRAPAVTKMLKRRCGKVLKVDPWQPYESLAGKVMIETRGRRRPPPGIQIRIRIRKETHAKALERAKSVKARSLPAFLADTIENALSEKTDIS
jgi:hypothetical protein